MFDCKASHRHACWSHGAADFSQSQPLTVTKLNQLGPENINNMIVTIIYCLTIDSNNIELMFVLRWAPPLPSHGHAPTQNHGACPPVHNLLDFAVQTFRY